MCINWGLCHVVMQKLVSLYAFKKKQKQNNNDSSGCNRCIYHICNVKRPLVNNLAISMQKNTFLSEHVLTENVATS